MSFSTQKELDKIKNQYSKIEKERLSKKKTKENALIFFNGVHTGKTNKNNLPDGKGTIMFQSRDKDYPDDNDIYITKHCIECYKNNIKKSK